MRVLSSALFSSCILILIHDDNLFLTEICTITEKPVFYEDKSIFYEQVEKNSDVPEFFVCNIKACNLKIKCPLF